VLAPGSAAVWHPDVPAAAAVLGSGSHPISLFAPRPPLPAVLALLLLGLKALHTTEHRLARSLLAAALAGGAAVYVHAAFDFNLRIPSNALMASLLAALCASAILPAAEPTATAKQSLRSVAGAFVLAVSFFTALATPWSEPRWDPAALARATAPGRTDLRRSALESDPTAFLRRRPGNAAAWVLRLPVSREDGSALARWGVGLDPRQEELARVSAPLLDPGR